MARFRPFIVATLVFLLLLGLGQFIFTLVERQRQAERRQQLDTIGNQQAYTLQRQLDRSLSATYALASILRQNEGNLTNFDALAQDMISRYGGISSLQLAPDGVVRQIYPLAGNEAAIGHDLVHDPARQVEVQKAIASRALTLAGPVNLVQGGVAVIGRLPVFVPDGSGDERFWGFTIVLIRLPDLLAASNLHQLVAQGYAYELARIDPTTGQRVVFAHDGPHLQHPVSVPITVPNGTWTLSLGPQTSSQLASSLLPELMLVVLISLVVALATYQTLRLPERLRREVQLRTQELAATNDHLTRTMTERRRMEEVLRASETRFRALVQHASDIITVMDPDGTRRYVSPAIEEALGYTPAELVGGSALAVVHPDDVEARRANLALVARQPGLHAPVEFRIRHRDGSWRYWEAISTNLLDEPGVRGIVVNARDITERRRLEDQLRHQAFHDPLTGLANRALFLDRVEHALAHRQPGQTGIAVLFLDLDRFKVVNDSLGHEEGDRLLVAVAERLVGSVRPADTVARFGGDEFSILLEGVTELRDATHGAERLLAALETPFTVKEQELIVTASIGIVLSTRDAATPQALIRDADVALYRAKTHGKARYALFDPSMHARALERLALEHDLRQAVELGAFVLHYQPIVNLTTGRVVGLEALVRWPHPTRGLVAPTVFIPLAEELGLIRSLGRWVLESACRQAGHWPAPGPGHAALTLSVNLSAREFQQPHLVEDVAQVLREVGLVPQQLKLEVTESVVMEDAATTSGTLGALKALGVRLAIDDFGTGYSSLSYLKRFPLDTLKIDRAFVTGLGVKPEDEAIVRAVITLAHTLGLEVTAEGIETAGQLARLRALGCELGQGYYFAKPLTPEAVDALLAAGGLLAGDVRDDHAIRGASARAADH